MSKLLEAVEAMPRVQYWGENSVAQDAVRLVDLVALIRQHPDYIPQDIAQDLLAMLAPFERAGEPNTVWALTKYVTAQLAQLLPVLDAAKALEVEQRADGSCIVSEPGIRRLWEAAIAADQPTREPDTAA